MSFETKVWIDRHSEYPTRRQLTAVPGQEGVYDMQRAEGLVYQDGDPFDQAQMNGLENRVAAAFGQLETGAQKVGAARQADQTPWGGITGKPATYPATAHTHTPGEAGAAPASHSHTPASLGAATTATYTATISTSWSGSGPYTQNVAVAGIVAADNPIVDLVLSGTTATDIARLDGWAMVGRMTAYAGGVTVTCYEARPTVAMPIQLKVVR